MTIYDIAEKAGVSASTVSRVINNKPGIKASTRKKVQSLLEENNFSVSETARGLVNKNSRMIGILISDIRYQHFAEGAYIIEEQFLEDGYCSLIFNTGSSDESKCEYIRILASRRVEGVALIGSGFCTEKVKEAILSYMPDTPIVIANGEMELDTVTSVVADEFWGVGELVSRLYQFGKKRIIYIGDKNSPSSINKVNGYLDKMANLNLKPIFLGVDDRSAEHGYNMTKEYFKSCNADAIIYGVDILAVGGARALLDLGLSIPGDVSIYGIDNSIYAEISNPKLSSLDTKLDEMCISCARNLSLAINGKRTIKKIILQPEIVERESGIK